jgi:hypothetical protein
MKIGAVPGTNSIYGPVAYLATLLENIQKFRDGPDIHG